jgi:hypothetical protein
MSKQVFEEGDEGVKLIIKGEERVVQPSAESRSPVHVVYGGAHLFNSSTPQKLGRIALATLDRYAASSSEFASAIGLTKDESAEFTETVYQRTLHKLQNEPVEDFRIDFEDGYGFRINEEEDAHSVSGANELASSFLDGSITAFSGFRIKPLAPETYERSVRTLNVFLKTFLERTSGRLPENFVVTLPKITNKDEVKILAKLLDEIEENAGLEQGKIGVELMIETPQGVIDYKGRIAPPRLVKAADGRCRSVHFGAYDFTSLLGIAATHQSISHESCNFARQAMLVSLSPLGIRLSDSVTTEMPVPPHKGDPLSEDQLKQNREVVHSAWKTHFTNVTRSMINGFYQSWDLHPNQLPSRYAAVYSFFLSSLKRQGERLRGFIEKSTQATLTGNVFDDAASAQGIVNFFRRGIDCGAFSAEEAETASGLTSDEIRRGSFLEIMNRRR